MNDKGDEKIRSRTSIIVALIGALAVLAAALIGVWPSLHSTPTKEVSCIFNETSDEASIKNIINVETTATMNKDLSTIELIYFPDATITDNGQTWQDPIEHYKWVFANFDLLSVNNSDIRIKFTSDEYAVVNRTASGRAINKTTHETGDYIDDSGELIFRKDPKGCWRISRFDKAPNGYKLAP